MIHVDWSRMWDSNPLHQFGRLRCFRLHLCDRSARDPGTAKSLAKVKRGKKERKDELSAVTEMVAGVGLEPTSDGL